MLEQFIKMLEEWAISDNHIESVIIVGSYARGTNTENSDLDICIITTNKDKMISNQEFTEYFGNIQKKQTEYYGACTSIRVWYKNRQEIEFGLVEPSWITLPLDDGTYKVLRDGYKVIIDKKEYFKQLELK